MKKGKKSFFFVQIGDVFRDSCGYICLKTKKIKIADCGINGVPGNKEGYSNTINLTPGSIGFHRFTKDEEEVEEINDYRLD